MAYAKKYTIEYKRLSNNTTNIEIWQNGYTGSTIELTPDGNPLIISINGTQQNIYTPSYGQGATINILAEPLTMLDLYTEDPQEFPVFIYNDTTLIWQGYITTEIYGEDYSVSDELLTSISIQCNDGMSLLNEMPYNDEDQNQYTGFTSIGGVLENIFGKLQNKYTDIIMLSDYTITTGDTTNLFTGLTVNNENYYDEKGEAMTCRQVINSIFQGLGLVIELSANKIIVYDPTLLREPDYANEYDFSPGYTFAETSTTLGGFKNIGSDVPWFKTGQQLDMTKSFNQIEVKYNPYTFTASGYDFDEEENQVEPYVYTTGGTGEEKYRYSNNVEMEGWTDISGSSFSVISQITDNVNIADVIGSPRYFYKMFNTTTGGFEQIDPYDYVEYEFPYSNIRTDENTLLQLSFDVYINTIDQNNIITPDSDSATIISRVPSLCAYKINMGDSWYQSYDGAWRNNEIFNFVDVRQSDADWRTTTETEKRNFWGWLTNKPKRRYYVNVDDSRVNDTWTSVVIPIYIDEAARTIMSEGGGYRPDSLEGSIKLRLYKEYLTPIVYDETQTQIDPTDILNVGLTNISLEVVNTTLVPIDSDGISTIATLPSSEDYVKKTDLSVKLTSGTGPYGESKGAFSSPLMEIPNANIDGLYRSGETETHSTAWNVTQQLLSQYQKPRKLITGTWDVQTDLLGIRYKLLNDFFLPGLNFYVLSGTYNDKDESFDGKILEVATAYEDLPYVGPTPTPPTPTPTPVATTKVYVTVSSALDYDVSSVRVDGDLLDDITFPVEHGTSTYGTTPHSGYLDVQVRFNGTQSTDDSVSCQVQMGSPGYSDCIDDPAPIEDFTNVPVFGNDIDIFVDEVGC